MTLEVIHKKLNIRILKVMIKNIIKIQLILIGIVLFTQTSYSQTKTIPQNKKFIIQSAMNYGKNPGGCWDIPGVNKLNKGKNLEIYRYDKGCDQHFSLQNRDNSGYYNIYSCNNKRLYIDVANWKRKNGTNVLLWLAHGGNNQKFRFHHLGHGRFKIEAKTGGYLCLKGRRNSNGTNIHIWENHNGPWMEWYLLDPVTRKAFVPKSYNKKPINKLPNPITKIPVNNDKVKDVKAVPGKIITHNLKNGNAAFISTNKNNIIYAGIPNPIDLEMSGINFSDVKITTENCTLKKEGKGYYVKTDKKGKCSISVTDKRSNKLISKNNFRIKSIPIPKATVARMFDGIINKNVLLAQSGIYAGLRNFEFDVRFRVTKFTVLAYIKTYKQEQTSNSDMFTPQQKSIFKKLRTKDKVYIYNIEAIGPDNKIRKLPAISLRIK